MIIANLGEMIAGGLEELGKDYDLCIIKEELLGLDEDDMDGFELALDALRDWLKDR